MSHQQLIDMTRNLIAHGEADTMEYADDVLRVPASAYTDPEQFEREKKRMKFSNVSSEAKATCPTLAGLKDVAKRRPTGTTKKTAKKATRGTTSSHLNWC